MPTLPLRDKAQGDKGRRLQRYQALVRHRPEILRNVPLKIIASYLGITPEYLSTLRKLP